MPIKRRTNRGDLQALLTARLSEAGQFGLCNLRHEASLTVDRDYFNHHWLGPLVAQWGT